LFPDGLDLQLDLQALAHEDAAGLEGLIPGHAPSLTVDLGGGSEAGR